MTEKNMMETPGKVSMLGSISGRARKAVTVAAMSLVLTGCSLEKTPEEIQKANQREYEKKKKEVLIRTQKVEGLLSELDQAAINFHDVNIQWQIQEDLKKEGADPTINQEIGHSRGWSRDQDRNIAQIKDELAEAQKELAKAEEECAAAAARIQPESNDTPKPDKYNYIHEEISRAKKDQSGCGEKQ